jgi:hypothetical protein
MHSLREANCLLIVWTAVDFEVIYTEEPEINLTKFPLTLR